MVIRIQWIDIQYDIKNGVNGVLNGKIKKY